MTTADPAIHLYDPSRLSPDEAQALTSRLLAECDDGELYLQFSASESFTFDDGRLKTADYSRDSGFGLRGVSGEMTGFAHANEISAAAIARAGETLRLLDPTAQPMAAPPQRSNRHLYTADNPLDSLGFAEKVRLLETIDATARARDPRVAQVTASLTAEWNEYCTFQIGEGGDFAIEVYDEDPDATMDGFAGGWSWETDAELVELVRELDVARSFVDPTASVEVYWAVTPSVR